MCVYEQQKLVKSSLLTISDNRIQYQNFPPVYIYHPSIWPRKLSTRQKILESTSSIFIFLDLEFTNRVNFRDDEIPITDRPMNNNEI